MIFIILTLMLFIRINKKIKIIEDTGYIKCELVLFGLLLFFISLIFNNFNNYETCVIKYFTKHCGILLIYNMFFIYISTGCQLGLNYKDIEYKEILPFNNLLINSKESDKETTMKETKSFNEKMLLEVEKGLNNFENVNSGYNLKKVNSKMSIIKANINMDDKCSCNINLNGRNKQVEYIHIINTELVILYIIFLIIFISITISYKSKSNILYQEFDGKWRYQCPFDYVDSILNLIELIMLFYLFFKAIRVWNYCFVFKCLRFIGCANGIWIVMGPFINVLYFFFYL